MISDCEVSSENIYNVGKKVNLFNYIISLFYMFLRSRNSFAVRVIQSAKTKSESWTACSQWEKKKSRSYNLYIYIYIYILANR